MRLMLRSPAVAPISNTTGPGSGSACESLVIDRIAGGEFTPASWLSSESDGGMTQPARQPVTEAIRTEIPTIVDVACTVRARHDLPHDCKRLRSGWGGNGWLGSDIRVMALSIVAQVLLDRSRG